MAQLVGEGQASTIVGCEAKSGRLVFSGRLATDQVSYTAHIHASADHNVNEVCRIQIAQLVDMVHVSVRIVFEPVQVDERVPILGIIHLFSQHQADPMGNPAVRVCLVGLRYEQVNQRLDGGPASFLTLGQGGIHHHHVDL